MIKWIGIGFCFAAGVFLFTVCCAFMAAFMFSITTWDRCAAMMGDHICYDLFQLWTETSAFLHGWGIGYGYFLLLVGLVWVISRIYDRSVIRRLTSEKAARRRERERARERARSEPTADNFERILREAEGRE